MRLQLGLGQQKVTDAEVGQRTSREMLCCEGLPAQTSANKVNTKLFSAPPFLFSSLAAKQ